MHRRRGRTHKRAASSQIYLPARESVSVAYISTFLAAGKEKRVPLSRTFDGSFFFLLLPLSPLTLYTHTTTYVHYYNLHLLPALAALLHNLTDSMVHCVQTTFFFLPSVDGLCYCCVSLRADNRFLQSGIILIGSTFSRKCYYFFYLNAHNYQI